MLLIGLGHKARQGKDTLAQECERALGDVLKIRLHSFADPLREEVRQAAHLSFEYAHPGEVFDPQVALRLLCIECGVDFEENAQADADYPWGKQRRLHQWWGTEYRRAQDGLYWVKKARAIVDAAQTAEVDALFFRDLRFPNEYDLIGEMGGYRIKIFRPSYVSDVPQHISEHALDDAAFDIQLGVRDDLTLLKKLALATFQGLLPDEQATKLETSANVGTTGECRPSYATLSKRYTL